jgi:hypothetical protein
MKYGANHCPHCAEPLGELTENSCEKVGDILTVNCFHCGADVAVQMQETKSIAFVPQSFVKELSPPPLAIGTYVMGTLDEEGSQHQAWAFGEVRAVEHDEKRNLHCNTIPRLPGYQHLHKYWYVKQIPREFGDWLLHNMKYFQHSDVSMWHLLAKWRKGESWGCGYAQ